MVIHLAIVSVVLLFVWQTLAGRQFLDMNTTFGKTEMLSWIATNIAVSQIYWWAIHPKLQLTYYKKKIIMREDKVPYLVRYSIFGCRFFSIKVHKILISDYDCLHDHPWAFITLILKGGYTEVYEKKIRLSPTMYHGETYASFTKKKVTKFRKPLSLLYRPARFKHKLEVDKPAWTFVITFKRIREWGFWTSTGFVNWRRYVGRGGAPCE